MRRLRIVAIRVVTACVLFVTAASAAEYVTQSVGGAGGGPYTTKCTTNKVMVGVQAKAGWYVDSIQPLCAGIYSDGKWNSTPALEGMQAGGAGGAIIKLLCPQDHAVSGIQGKTGGLLERLQISCNLMGANGLLTGNPSVVSTIAGDGEGGTFGPFNFGPLYCQDWKPGKGFTGNSGQFVDKVAMICDTGIPTTPIVRTVYPYYSVGLSSPADNATVDVTNGITFSWAANLQSGGYFQFCLTKDVVNTFPASCDLW